MQQSQQIKESEDSHIIPLYKKRDITLARGEGMYVFDTEGRKYLDFSGQYGTTVLGHGNAALKKALAEQADNIISVHNSFYCEARAELAKKLADALPEPLSRVFFLSTGTECVEAALKFARGATKRKKIVAAKGAYHGRTFGALSVTGQPKYQKGYEPLVPDITHVPFNDLEAIENEVNGETAAVILEPIQAESGIRMPDEDYLSGVKKLCEKNGALLICDEIQVGTYRTGTLLASEQYGVTPDIVCLSKAIGNGLPLGVVAVSEEISGSLPPGCHGTTFGGNALCCRAGTTVLEEIQKKKLADNVREMGEFLLEELKKLQSECDRIREVRGRGLIIGIEFKEKVSPIIKAMQENGVLTLPAGATILRILPSYIVSRGECEVFIKTLKDILQ